MKVMVTGHRPSKIGGDSKDNPVRAKIIQKIKFLINELNDLAPIEGITGMAIGVDQDFAEICMDLDIPFLAYIPFVGQENNWPVPVKAEYQNILERSEDIIVVNEGGYTPKKMMERNVKMLEDCDIIIAVWDGEESGGTYHTVNENRKSFQKPMIHIKP